MVVVHREGRGSLGYPLEVEDKMLCKRINIVYMCLFVYVHLHKCACKDIPMVAGLKNVDGMTPMAAAPMSCAC